MVSDPCAFYNDGSVRQNGQISRYIRPKCTDKVFHLKINKNGQFQILFSEWKNKFHCTLITLIVRGNLTCMSSFMSFQMRTFGINFVASYHITSVNFSTPQTFTVVDSNRIRGRNAEICPLVKNPEFIKIFYKKKHLSFQGTGIWKQSTLYTKISITYKIP